ncbi:DUF6101 family protein, partial [Bradyrhizobium zhanjiangense]
VRFDAHDPRADGHVRQIELHRERVVLRRAVRGMQMAINVRVSDFTGVALRGNDEAQALILVHRDPSLSVPLLVGADGDELTAAWAIWSEIFALPQLDEDARKPAPRRRRTNAIRARRPKFLMRRRTGIARELSVHRGEREIIARN